MITTSSRESYETERLTMVKRQLLPNRVGNEAVLDAFASIPREIFVAPAFRTVAYKDTDTEIGFGRYLWSPILYGRLLQAADVRLSDLALVVGCGLGYTAAVISRLASHVTALEEHPEWIASFKETFAPLDITNVECHVGPLTEGVPAHAPYDVIIIAGSVEEIPVTLSSQLAEGGRLITVLMDKTVGRAVIQKRFGSSFTTRALFDAPTHLLPGFSATKKFDFFAA